MTKLTRRRLEWLVRARGTDLAAWPERDRLGALALLRSSPEAQAWFAEALVADEAPEGEQEADRAVFDRMQQALRRSLAPLPLLLRGLGAGALMACVAAGLYLAMSVDGSASQIDPDAMADPFSSAQTISLAAVDQ